MYVVEQVARSSVSQSVAAAIREMILDGRLRDGERVNEVRLSEALGVSRTPLREALNRLAAEGALTSVAGHGHVVAPLNASEFDQLYDIRPILDPAALALCNLPTREQLTTLSSLNMQLQRATDGEMAIELDNRWHLLLLADCPNRILVDLIKSTMQRTRRYELALLRERPRIVAASSDHQRILAALRAGDSEAACTFLRENMQSGKGHVLEWLKMRDAGQPGFRRAI